MTARRRLRAWLRSWRRRRDNHPWRRRSGAWAPRPGAALGRQIMTADQDMMQRSRMPKHWLVLPVQGLGQSKMCGHPIQGGPGIHHAAGLLPPGEEPHQKCRPRLHSCRARMAGEQRSQGPTGLQQPVDGARQCSGPGHSVRMANNRGPTAFWPPPGGYFRG